MRVSNNTDEDPQRRGGLQGGQQTRVSVQRVTDGRVDDGREVDTIALEAKDVLQRIQAGTLLADSKALG